MLRYKDKENICGFLNDYSTALFSIILSSLKMLDEKHTTEMPKAWQMIIQNYRTLPKEIFSTLIDELTDSSMWYYDTDYKQMDAVAIIHWIKEVYNIACQLLSTNSLTNFYETKESTTRQKKHHVPHAPKKKTTLLSVQNG